MKKLLFFIVEFLFIANMFAFSENYRPGKQLENCIVTEISEIDLPVNKFKLILFSPENKCYYNFVVIKNKKVFILDTIYFVTDVRNNAIILEKK